MSAFPKTSDLSEAERKTIGQHFVVGFPGPVVDQQITKLIKEYYVGNVIIFKRNIQSFEQLQKLILQLQLMAQDAGHERPLLIGIDQENGLVSAFTTPDGRSGSQFPGAMALAASGSPNLAERVTAASAKELKAAGIGWAYSPICDVNSDPQNPVIGVRSYGDDPHQAALYAAAVSRGLLSSDVASCGKHFPGHGDTSVDSHLALPTIIKSLQELEKTELVPFSELFKQDIMPSVMTAHIALPALLNSSVDPPNTPASLARSITTSLLRERLHYAGVAVTDCLEMDAISAPYGCGRGAVMALQAGADMVMVCHRLERQVDALETTYAAVASGALKIPQDSGERVKKFKERFAGTWDSVLHPTEVDWPAMRTAHTALARAAYDQCVAILPASSGSSTPSGQSTLPIPPSARVILLTPALQRSNAAVDDETDGVLRTTDGALRNTSGPAFQSLTNALHPARTIVLGPDEAVAATFKRTNADAEVFNFVVVALRNGLEHGGWQLQRLRDVVELLHAPVSPVRNAQLVVLSTGTPYDLAEAGNIAPFAARVATFEYTRDGLEAGVRVLRGDEGAKGGATVPVVI